MIHDHESNSFKIKWFHPSTTSFRILLIPPSQNLITKMGESRTMILGNLQLQKRGKSRTMILAKLELFVQMTQKMLNQGFATYKVIDLCLGLLVLWWQSLQMPSWVNRPAHLATYRPEGLSREKGSRVRYDQNIWNELENRGVRTATTTTAPIDLSKRKRISCSHSHWCV